MPSAPSPLVTLSPCAVVLGTGIADSLQNIDTTIVPDGACCWVIENETLYRLNKSTAPFGQGNIAPASGPGHWVALSGNALPRIIAQAHVHDDGSGPVIQTSFNVSAVVPTANPNYVGVPGAYDVVLDFAIDKDKHTFFGTYDTDDPTRAGVLFSAGASGVSDRYTWVRFTVLPATAIEPGDFCVQVVRIPVTP